MDDGYKHPYNHRINSKWLRRCFLGRWIPTWISRLIGRNYMLGFSNPSSNFTNFVCWWQYVLFRLWSEEDSNDKFENADVNRDKLVTWSEYKDEEYDGMDDWVDIEMDR